MSQLTKEQWLSSLQAGTVEVELLDGMRVTIKRFTKREIDDIRQRAMKNGELDQDQFERELILAGLVAPALAAEELPQLEQSATAYYTVLGAILDENGLSAIANRAMRRSFRPRS